MNNICVNSDDSVLFLRAKDILQGNVFLKDWYGSTVSQIFSYLPPAILGILINGYNINAIYVVSALILTINFFLITKLIYSHRTSKLTMFITICCMVFRAFQYFVINNFGHAELMTYIILMFILLQQIYSENNNKKSQRYFYILMLIANITSDLCYYVFTIPLIFITLVRYLKEKNKIDINLTISSVVILILSKIFNCTTTILGLWRYGGTGTKYFCTFESIGNNISGTLHFFLRYFNADFWGEKIFSLQSYCNLVGFLLFIISVLVLCYNIKNFFKVNIVDQVLVLGGVDKKRIR